MFTGIILKTAVIRSVSEVAWGTRIKIAALTANHIVGESIAVNGCCLTVADFSNGVLAFDIIPETLAKTNLSDLVAGNVVHIERSLRAGDPIDGHFVQGHVDGVGKLVGQVADDREWRLRIE